MQTLRPPATAISRARFAARYHAVGRVVCFELARLYEHAYGYGQVKVRASFLMSAGARLTVMRPGGFIQVYFSVRRNHGTCRRQVWDYTVLPRGGTEAVP